MEISVPRTDVVRSRSSKTVAALGRKNTSSKMRVFSDPVIPFPVPQASVARVRGRRLRARRNASSMVANGFLLLRRIEMLPPDPLILLRWAVMAGSQPGYPSTMLVSRRGSDAGERERHAWLRRGPGH